MLTAGRAHLCISSRRCENLVWVGCQVPRLGSAVMSVSGDHDADMNVDGRSVGRIQRGMDLLRRVLQYQVSIGALI